MKLRAGRSIASLGLWVGLASLSACGEHPLYGRVPTISLSIAPEAVVIPAVGREVKLEITAMNGAGQSAEPPVVAWASGDPAVATVDRDGVVTAVGHGATTVRATVEGVTAEVPVVVQARLWQKVWIAAVANRDVTVENDADSVSVVARDARMATTSSSSAAPAWNGGFGAGEAGAIEEASPSGGKPPR